MKKKKQQVFDGNRTEFWKNEFHSAELDERRLFAFNWKTGEQIYRCNNIWSERKDTPKQRQDSNVK